MKIDKNYLLLNHRQPELLQNMIITYDVIEVKVKVKRWLIAVERAICLVSTIIVIRKKSRFWRIIKCSWWKGLLLIKYLHSRICSGLNNNQRMRDNHLNWMYLKNKKKVLIIRVFKMQKLYWLNKLIQREIL